jgi:hypothetical protein
MLILHILHNCIAAKMDVSGFGIRSWGEKWWRELF